MSTQPRTIGQALRMARMKQDTTVAEAAEGVGLSVGRLSNIEAGYWNLSKLPWITAERIRGVYGEDGSKPLFDALSKLANAP